jgi:hypothetical protein
MARKQQFQAPVSHVAGGDLHVHQYADSAPPDDPAMSVQCWQCKRLTWRYTRHCIHCMVELQRPKVGWFKAILARCLGGWR